MADDELRDVHACHEKFLLPIGEKLGPISDDHIQKRIDFLEEEWTELKEARDIGNFPKMVDALLDLVYVAKGTAVMMGITPELWSSLWDEVHHANMQKERDPDGDDYHFGLRKPEGWTPPQIEEILETAHMAAHEINDVPLWGKDKNS